MARYYKLKPRRKNMKRVRRKGLVRKSGLIASKAQMKHYNYNFRLSPQAITSSQTVVGSVGVNANSSVLPIANAASNFAVYSGSLGIAQVADWAAACSHRISDINNITNFTSMYDSYRLNSVTVTLEYLSNSAGVNSGSLLPTFYMYWDADDATIPPNLRTILGKVGSKRWQPTSSRLTKKFTFKPQQSVAIEGDAAGVPTVAVTPGKSQWTDCTSPRVPHYAFKLYCQDWLATGEAAAVNCVRIHYTYNVSFRSPLVCS